MLTRTGLVLRSARFHWRANIGALLAAAAGCAVLTGALLVGDSVRHSLRATAIERLGTTQAALIGGDRFFKADLADRLMKQPSFNDNFENAEPMLMLPGVVASDETQRRVNEVQVYGIRASFWELENIFSRYSLKKFAGDLKPGEVAINSTLAHQLRIEGGGSTIRIRLFKPGILPHDAPLGSSDEQSAFLRLRIKTVIWPRGIARFSLRAEQSVPPIAFVGLKELQSLFDEKDAANVLLFSGPRSQELNPRAVEDATPLLDKAWTEADAQLRLRETKTFCELRTARIFLDDSLVAGILPEQKDAQSLTTYFVNAIRANGKETPYSMVTAAGPPLTDPDLKDDEIMLNDWTAEDLSAKPGDNIELEYYVVGNQRKLETRKASFKLKSIVPRDRPGVDGNLMPDFPGIANVESTGDWKAGIPIDKKKIRAKDEEYWKERRGTPKAFISLKRGVELWSNRFGTYTAIRFPGTDNCPARRESILRYAKPEKLGVALVPVKAQALQAANQSMDFGGLFLGLSFFLIVAALLLMALIFQFGVESRARETGVLLALGFTTKSVRRLLWGEGVVAAAAGAPLGAIGGVYYARALLASLSSRWRDAVGGAFLEFNAQPLSLLIGTVATVAVAALAIYFAVRKQAARPARELLNERGQPQAAPKTMRGWKIAGVVCLVGAVALIAMGFKSSGPAAAGLFFGSGAMLLVSALAAVRWMLMERNGWGRHSCLPADKNVCPTKNTALPSLGALGIRAARRKPGRSQSTAALLAIGSFLVCAIGVNELDANADASSKSSGTGGFALFARATIPIYEDLNSTDGREKLGLDESGVLSRARFHALRVKAGDEASCLNLNRAQQPRIVGMPQNFLKRGGFSFVEKSAGTASGQTDWEALFANRSGYAIPAVCDAQSLQWALHLGIGDEFAIQDEHGVERKLKFVGAIANSIMQGSIMISENDFLKLYPSESGYRQFLIDAAPAEAKEVADALSRGLENNGFEVQPAADRLAAFNAVQNTYLATFQALGALGMLLGSLGLGLVVLRNMLDRRAELSMLRVIGFSRAKIGWMIAAEHAWILTLGLGAGMCAALAAIAPSLRVAGGAFPWQSMSVTVLGIAGVGLSSALLATWSALRAPVLAGLRGE